MFTAFASGVRTDGACDARAWADLPAGVRRSSLRMQDATSRKTEAPDPDTRRAGAARAVGAEWSGPAAAGDESTDRAQLPGRLLQSRERQALERHGANRRQMARALPRAGPARFGRSAAFGRAALDQRCPGGGSARQDAARKTAGCRALEQPSSRGDSRGFAADGAAHLARLRAVAPGTRRCRSRRAGRLTYGRLLQ